MNTVNTSTSNRLTLITQWARAHAEFHHTRISDHILSRVEFSVRQLNDQEVRDLLN